MVAGDTRRAPHAGRALHFHAAHGAPQPAARLVAHDGHRAADAAAVDDRIRDTAPARAAVVVGNHDTAADDSTAFVDQRVHRATAGAAAVVRNQHRAGDAAVVAHAVHRSIAACIAPVAMQRHRRVADAAAVAHTVDGGTARATTLVLADDDAAGLDHATARVVQRVDGGASPCLALVARNKHLAAGDAAPVAHTVYLAFIGAVPAVADDGDLTALHGAVMVVHAVAVAAARRLAAVAGDHHTRSGNTARAAVAQAGGRGILAARAGARLVGGNAHLRIAQAAFVEHAGRQCLPAIAGLHPLAAVAQNGKSAVRDAAVLAHLHAVRGRQPLARLNSGGRVAGDRHTALSHRSENLHTVGACRANALAHGEAERPPFIALAADVARPVAGHQHIAALHLPPPIERQGVGIDAATVRTHGGCLVAQHGCYHLRQRHRLLAIQVDAVGHQHPVAAASQPQRLPRAATGLDVGGAVAGQQQLAAFHPGAPVGGQAVHQCRSARGANLPGLVARQRHGTALQGGAVMQHQCVRRSACLAVQAGRMQGPGHRSGSAVQPVHAVARQQHRRSQPCPGSFRHHAVGIGHAAVAAHLLAAVAGQHQLRILQKGLRLYHHGVGNGAAAALEVGQPAASQPGAAASGRNIRGFVAREQRAATPHRGVVQPQAVRRSRAAQGLHVSGPVGVLHDLCIAQFGLRGQQRVGRRHAGQLRAGDGPITHTAAAAARLHRFGTVAVLVDLAAGQRRAGKRDAVREAAGAKGMHPVRHVRREQHPAITGRTLGELHGVGHGLAGQI